jgi:Fic family protein
VKTPARPPIQTDLWKRFATEESAGRLVERVREPTVDGKYLHWDQIRHRRPPSGLSHEEWWFALKIRRDAAAQALPMCDKKNAAFKYSFTQPLAVYLYQVDRLAIAGLEQSQGVTSPETRDYYLVRSLVEESIASSQLEGASTTRAVAKRMLMENRSARDRSERMIRNNYQTMQRILEIKDQRMTNELLCEIHRMVTDGTFQDASASGRFRRSAENILVTDQFGEILHVPPPAEELESRIEHLLAFANEDDPATFTHPALKAMILHFWLAYEHPFVDGNGRTARALYYWSMLKHGYWLHEYISISRIILKAPVRYGMAFLYSETDENDLTYFLLYHADVVSKALEELKRLIDEKAQAISSANAELGNETGLNHRQRDLIAHALKHPNDVYSVRYHQHANNVVYETARRDLLGLASRGLLKKRKVGKTWSFTVPADLRQRLRRRASR